MKDDLVFLKHIFDAITRIESYTSRGKIPFSEKG